MSGQHKQNKPSTSHDKIKNSKAGDRHQSITTPSKSSFVGLMAINRFLLALFAALFLILLLVRFTDIADAAIGAIGLVVALVLYLFPTLTDIPKAPWFKGWGVTIALASLVVFVIGLVLFAAYEKTNQPLVAEPQVVSANTPTAIATQVRSTPVRLVSVTLSPSPTPQPTSLPSRTPAPRPTPSPTTTATPQKILIELAIFDGPDQEKYRVTDTLYQNLAQRLSEYSDVEISRLDQSFKTSEDARAYGKEKKAAMVFWGWYGATSDVAPVSVHLEVLCLRCPPELGPEAQGQLRLHNVEELNTFALQTNLSVELSYLSHFIVGMARYEAGKLDDAIASFTTALEQTQDPIPALDKTKIYYQRAYAYSDRGKYDLAIADLNEVIQIDSKSAWAYNYRGVIYNKMSNFDLAIADLTHAIELAPQEKLYRKNRGVLYDNKQEYDNAISDFNKLLETATSGPEAYILRGNVYFEMKNYNNAIKDYSEAIRRKNDDYIPYRNRGATYYAIEQDDAAIADFTQAIKLKGDDAGLYNSRGAAYFRKGEYDPAIADINQAITLEKSDASFYYNRGVARASQHEYDKAITDFDQAIKLSPNNANYWYSRGGAYAAMENYEAAITNYTQAIDLQSSNGDYYFDRGHAYMLAGQPARAISDFKQVLKLGGDPNNVDQAKVYLRSLGAY